MPTSLPCNVIGVCALALLQGAIWPAKWIGIILRSDTIRQRLRIPLDTLRVA